MTADPADRRAVTLTRDELGRYTVRNAAGVELTFGHGEDLLSPVELLLAAVGGCSAIDVDHITARRAEPEAFEVEISGAKTTDESGGHRLDDIVVDFRLRFPADAAGEEAASVVARSAAQSRDRLCTVSRTVALPTQVTFEVDGTPLA